MKQTISFGTFAVLFTLCCNYIEVQARSPRVMIPSNYDNNMDQQSNYYYYQSQVLPPTPPSVQQLPVSQDTSFQVVHRAPGEVKIVSKSTYTDSSSNNFVGGVSTGKNSRLGESRRKKVDVEKFKECIFFRLCSKAQCFHYGRHNTCE